MSKPKKGYTRWTVDIKDSIATKIRVEAAKSAGGEETPKSICQKIIESHFKPKQ